MGILCGTQECVGGFVKGAWRAHQPALSDRKATIKPWPDKWSKIPEEFRNGSWSSLWSVWGMQSEIMGYPAVDYTRGMSKNSMLLVSWHSWNSPDAWQRCFLEWRQKQAAVSWLENKALAILVGVLHVFWQLLRGSFPAMDACSGLPAWWDVRLLTMELSPSHSGQPCSFQMQNPKVNYYSSKFSSSLPGVCLWDPRPGSLSQCTRADSRLLFPFAHLCPSPRISSGVTSGPQTG